MNDGAGADAVCHEAFPLASDVRTFPFPYVQSHAYFSVPVIVVVPEFDILNLSIPSPPVAKIISHAALSIPITIFPLAVYNVDAPAVMSQYVAAADPHL